MKNYSKVIKKIISYLIVVFFHQLLYFSVPVNAAESFSTSNNIPSIYLDIIKKRLVMDNSLSIKDIDFVLGAEAFEKALKEGEPKNRQLIVLYVSRYTYDKLMSEYNPGNKSSISVLYFDPSIEQQLSVLTHILDDDNKGFEIVVLNSSLSSNYHKKLDSTLDVSVRTRLPDKKFSNLLRGGYHKKVFIVPADEYLLQDVALSDFISLLLDNESGLVAFAPSISNALASVYYRPTDYIEDLVSLIKVGKPFKAYPQNAHFKINPKIAFAIGIKLKGKPLKGYVTDLL